MGTNLVSEGGWNWGLPAAASPSPSQTQEIRTLVTLQFDTFSLVHSLSNVVPIRVDLL